MSKKIQYLSAALLLCSVLVAVPLVKAETSTTPTTANTTSTDDTSESQDEPTDKRPTKERVDALKAALRTKLTETEKEHIKTKCKTAQAAISSLHTRVNMSVTTRTKAYQKLTDRLNKAVEKLKTAGVDTTELESKIATLLTKIETYKTDLANYRQALSDLKATDCTTDPIAFKAALEAARTKRETLNKTVQDIRAYVSDTIKPTLVTMRNQIQIEAKKESETTN